MECMNVTEASTKGLASMGSSCWVPALPMTLPSSALNYSLTRNAGECRTSNLHILTPHFHPGT